MTRYPKGFHATSMRNIQEVIDMRPGSIYASFGSKEGLFKETLEFYAESGLTLFAESVAASGSPLAALESFIRKAVTKTSDAPSNMCMLVKSISELTEEDNAELLAESQQLLRSFECAFADLLTQAQVQGELAASKDPRRLARLLQVQLMGLRSYARANGDQIEAEELISDAFSCLH